MESEVRSLKPAADGNNKDMTKYRVIKHQLSLVSKAFNNQFSLITKVFYYFKTLNQRSSSQFTKVYNLTIRSNKLFKQIINDSGVAPGGNYVKGEEKEDTWTKETIDAIFREVDFTDSATI